MCNLYSITRSREAMLRLFRVGDNRAAAVEPKPAMTTTIQNDLAHDDCYWGA